jgi:hypothetical protein
MLVRFFALTSALKIIYQLEKLVFGGLDAGDCRVGYAKHFYGVIVNSPFNIMIGCSVYFNLPVNPFELRRSIIIGKVGNRYFD